MAKFSVLGQEYELPTDLDIGEICDVENEFGSSGARLTAGLIWIGIRRVNPKVTVEDIRAMRMDEVFSSISTEEDAGPPVLTPENSNGSGESSSPNGESSGNGLQLTGDLG